MTISSTVRKAGPFTGNDVADTFSFAFKVFSADDVMVTRSGLTTGTASTVVLSSDYTVSLNADQDTSPGGSITLVAGPLSSAYSITLTSQIAETHPAVFTNTGNFYPSVLNAVLDRIVAMVQQITERDDKQQTEAVADLGQRDDQAGRAGRQSCGLADGADERLGIIQIGDNQTGSAGE